MIGIIYKINPYKIFNGTLFYCFEYLLMLNKYKDCNLYILNMSEYQYQKIMAAFKDKYNINDDILNKIIPITPTGIYKLNLKKTLILDINTFNSTKPFLTNKILCYSNDTHENFRYNDTRKIIYYGSYDYQIFDKYCILKLGLTFLQPSNPKDSKIFISSLDPEFVDQNKVLQKLDIPFNKLLFKQNNSTIDKLFDYVSTFYYVHTSLDKNNRLIVESFWFAKEVIFEDLCPTILDSSKIRFNDIKENGLGKYILDENCEIIKEMLC